MKERFDSLLICSTIFPFETLNYYVLMLVMEEDPSMVVAYDPRGGVDGHALTYSVKGKIKSQSHVYLPNIVDYN